MGALAAAASLGIGVAVAYLLDRRVGRLRPLADWSEAAKFDLAAGLAAALAVAGMWWVWRWSAKHGRTSAGRAFVAGAIVAFLLLLFSALG
ncbi:MAG: hypothetical protein ABR562_04460 [Thermoplasmatota archaeon]